MIKKKEEGDDEKISSYERDLEQSKYQGRIETFHRISVYAALLSILVWIKNIALLFFYWDPTDEDYLIFGGICLFPSIIIPIIILVLLYFKRYYIAGVLMVLLGFTYLGLVTPIVVCCGVLTITAGYYSTKLKKMHN